MAKKLIAILLCAMMVVSILPLSGAGWPWPGQGQGQGQSSTTTQAQTVYVYMQITDDNGNALNEAQRNALGLVLNQNGYYNVGMIQNVELPAAGSVQNPSQYKSTATAALGSIIRYSANGSVVNSSIDITNSGITWTLKTENGADDVQGEDNLVESGTKTYHLDGAISINLLRSFTVNYVDEDRNSIAASKTSSAILGTSVTEDAIQIDGYVMPAATTQTITIANDANANVITFTYHKHVYTSEVTKEATCTEAGTTTYTCTCGNSYTETIPATGHAYNAGEVTTEPDCLNPGVTTYTCANCGDTYTGEIPALGHVAVTDAAVAPTCTETGKTEGSHCSRCNAVLTEQTIVPALGHAYQVSSKTAPTCTEDGATVYVCSRENTHTYTETPAATGHTVVTDAAEAPTCENTGLTEGSHCSVCGAVITAQEVVDALGHDWGEWEETTAPTCTATGTKTRTCKRDPSHTETQTVAALGHSYTEEITTEPSCTEKGVATYTCTRCNDSYTVELPPKGHTPGQPVTENEVAATCKTEGGYDTVVYCTVCDTELSREHTTIPYAEHTAATAVTENVIAATCTENGYHDEVVYCEKCGAELRRDTVVDDALGHAEVTDAAVEPTCTETGLTEGSHCSRCDAVLVAQKEIAALGHVPETDAAVAATCTEDGLTEGSHCSRCDAVLVAQEVVPATGHDWDDGVVTTAATCDGAGIITYTCKNDPTHVKTEALSANGHTPGEAVKENVVEPTCTQDGSYDEVVYCEKCGAELSRETTTVPATGHNWDEGVVTTEPTTTEEGVKTYTCEDCGETRTESIDKLPATETDTTVVVPATDTSTPASSATTTDDTQTSTTEAPDEEEISDEETPLTEAPDEETAEEETIEDDETPLSETPDMEDEDLDELDEDEVPLANLPQAGVQWAVVIALALGGVAAIVVSYRRRILGK